MSSLVTLTDVKTFMQITVTDSDALLQVYLDLVEDEIEINLDRKLERVTYSDVLEYKESRFDRTGYTNLDAGHDVPKLYIKNTPIVTLISIIDGGTTVTSTSYTYDSENGVLSPDSQLGKPTVTYIAGYNTVTFPKALQMVVNQGVSSLFYNNSASQQKIGNVSSKKLKDFSVAYGNNQTGYNTIIANHLVKTYLESNEHILKRYRRVEL